jgi:hypothetical protein
MRAEQQKPKNIAAQRRGVRRLRDLAAPFGLANGKDGFNRRPAKSKSEERRAEKQDYQNRGGGGTRLEAGLEKSQRKRKSGRSTPARAEKIGGGQIETKR